MPSFDFRQWARRAADWAVDYLATVRERPVRAQTAPGAIHQAIPAEPPLQGEPMEAIFADLDRTILPGMTHWQHPRFFAYFPANSSPPAVVAEFVTAAMAAQCMLWQTSPAATELEARMMEWLRGMIGLPPSFAGVIQDSATSATFAAVLTARERALSYMSNTAGLFGATPLRAYCSAEAHSSVDKAIRMAGIGHQNLVKLPSAGPLCSLDVAALDEQIREDKAAGMTPFLIVACLGGTSVGAVDDIARVADVARRHGIFLHVDAAWAGSAMICPEFRHLMRGAEAADSFVFNPHKWLFTNFDCSAHFVKDPKALTYTLGLRPAYLRTLGLGDNEIAGVTDYNEWSVPLGRRFRALKLWFVIRHYGVEALRAKIRDHVAWARELAGLFDADPDFELTSTPVLALFSFRYRPHGFAGDDAALDRLNTDLIEAINADGRIYLTQTRHQNRFVIRVQVGQTDTTRADVLMVLEVARELAARIGREG
ncbi:pyridoxal phosphate-dependent decarboxylase family protein [Prosthecomicrobium hirschii]|uniref:pyridoxal phosphate-dependent decarboxylase family protein n=1 Tax=Prosthecodimorpha hirschii TaxID=665126 RepID=UPI002220C957|nr:pyridoxal-dependent decarboxylase [Prosthecomicrobium hirschii]MCW1840795.1 pyridoxal-dependent decarboxylase [Prosthecomicrobium hirschii]